MANLSNINNILRISSSGVGLNKDNTGPSELDIESAGADIIDMTRTGQKTYRFAISGASAFSLFDVAANEDRLTIDTSGNATFAGDVGIGAAPTDGNLHVRKTGINTGITNVLMNANFADGSNGTGLSIGYRTDETTAVLAARTATGNIAFYSYDSGWSESMRIKNNGNVGIGTTSPGTFLQLGTYAVAGKYINQATYPDIPSEHMMHITAPSTNAYYGGGISFGETAFTAANIVVRDAGGSGALDLCFGTGTASGVTEKMRIANNGNVGIGETSPSGALHVKSSTATTTGMVRLQNDMDNNYETLRVESLGNYDAHIGFLANGTSAYWWGIGIDYSDSGKFKISGDNLLSVNTRLTIDTSGNVGIGTASPSQKLDVQGNVNINGTVVEEGSGNNKTYRYRTPNSNSYSGGNALITFGRFYWAPAHWVDVGPVLEVTLQCKYYSGYQRKYIIKTGYANNEVTINELQPSDTEQKITLQVGTKTAAGYDYAGQPVYYVDLQWTQTAYIWGWAQLSVQVPFLTSNPTSGWGGVVVYSALSQNNNAGTPTNHPSFFAGNLGVGTESPTSQLFVNNTADGDKIRWGRSNALVGSVGTYNGVPYIGYQGGAGGGIMFNGSSIEPTALGSTRSSSTNDIGSANYLWRNIYLSGGAYLGGTSTAHKLDFYKTDTWAPQIYYQNATDQANATNSTQTGIYTKIGNVCTVQFRLIWTITGTPAVDNIGIKNLPFGGHATNAYAQIPCFIKQYTGGPSPRGDLILTLPTANSTLALFADTNNVGNMGNAIGSGTKEIRFSFTYLTN